LVLGEPLGAGVHGSVFAAECQINGGRSAVKGHERQPFYYREREVYQRLRDLDLTTVRSCNVPALIDFDDELWVIEMTIVARPFVLDFAGAYLDDNVPDFSEEVLAEWQAEKQEQFGNQWRVVQAVLAALAGYGIHMLDVNPGNIALD
jgi:hypothetical protein